MADQPTPAQADDASAEPLPQQEAFFRPPARFGNVPVARTPLGWDPRNPGFRNHYPVVNLPTQIVERVTLGAPELEPNRLVWGDCLHVMRQLPSESIDLIYIDPPFFSNRTYNVIWGDDNEERSFSDIWEGGLDGYLVWLNARLYEMKRLLKPTGSIYVHCDWHASHYIKIEMDKIFGYDNFRNEIAWRRVLGGKSDSSQYGRSSDRLLYYTKTSQFTFTPPRLSEFNDATNEAWYSKSDSRGPYASSKLFAAGSSRGDSGQSWRGISPAGHWVVPRLLQERYEEEAGMSLRGKVRERLEILAQAGYIDFSKNGLPSWRRYLDEANLPRVHDLWVDEDTKPIARNSREVIGYPTQKPEALLERILNASSNEGDVVADFFNGGGTTAAVAQRLGRRFVGCDQSRVAIAVTAERLKQQAMTRGLEDAPLPDFTVEQWGIYEAERLSQTPPDEFRRFVLACYDARIPSSDDGIHGYKGSRARVPVWVGAPSLTAPVTVDDVNAFAQAIARLPRYAGEEGLRDGVMLAWGFAPDAVQAAQELRERGAADLAFVRLEQVSIDSPSFRQHIASQRTDRADYQQFLTFVQPPDVSFAHRRLKPLHYDFNASSTQSYNADAQIINVQWDFDYNGQVFHAARRPWAERAALSAQHTFPRAGTFTVACKVQDDKGGEGMRSAKVEVH